MTLLFADQWFLPSFTQSLGWTLLHSIWQGLIVAIIALAVLWLTRRSIAVLRYNLLLLLLTVFITTVVYTFWFQYNSAKTESATNIHSIQASERQSSFGVNTSSTIIIETRSFLNKFEQAFTNYANVIVDICF